MCTHHLEPGPQARRKSRAGSVVSGAMNPIRSAWLGRRPRDSAEAVLLPASLGMMKSVRGRLPLVGAVLEMAVPGEAVGQTANSSACLGSWVRVRQELHRTVMESSPVCGDRGTDGDWMRCWPRTKKRGRRTKDISRGPSQRVPRGRHGQGTNREGST